MKKITIELTNCNILGDFQNLDILENKKIIASFYFNMKGFKPCFSIKNIDGLEYEFSEKNASTQLKEFKKAIKLGFTNITIKK
tara:strand:- start:31 stop:279 length:249 start_codon:yes stop_codon:yes gene_type:complete